MATKLVSPDSDLPVDSAIHDLCELMNRDFFFYLLCTFIYFVVSV